MTRSFQAELAARREAIKSAVAGHRADSGAMLATAELPSLTPSAGSAGATPTSSRRSAPLPVTEVHEPSSIITITPAPAMPPRRRLALIAGIPAAAAVVLALWIVLRPGSKDAVGAAPPPAPAQVAAPTPPPVPPPVVAPPAPVVAPPASVVAPPAPVVAPPAPAPEAPSSPPSVPVAKRPPPRHAPPPRPTARHVAPPPSTTVPAPTKPAPTTPAKPWDPDSPLPPP